MLARSFLLPRGARLIGRIVVFDRPEGLMVKRVKRISEGRVWVEGDNQALSEDSRVFGWLEDRDLRGVLVGRALRL